MKTFAVRSKEYLCNEFKDAFHDFYVSVLDTTEKQLKPDRKSKEWEFYRFSILNMGNAYIRYVDELLSEYYIEFRPAVFSVKYKDTDNNAITKVARFNFEIIGSVPSFSVITENSQAMHDVLLDIMESLECGKIDKVGNELVFAVHGLYDIFHKVIPFLNGSLRGVTLDKFNAWKEKVYDLEGKGNK